MEKKGSESIYSIRIVHSANKQKPLFHDCVGPRDGFVLCGPPVSASQLPDRRENQNKTAHQA